MSYELIPGAPGSPVLLHVPHGARDIPRDVRAELLPDDRALGRELDHITDAHTPEIAGRAAARAPVRPWRFVNRLSRLVVDPERFPDEREEMLAAGMGAVYTRTTHREPLRPEPFPGTSALVGTYFEPYAEAVARAVDERLAACGRAVVLDVHSYPTRPLPYELHGTGERPPVCLGTDAFHTPDALVRQARDAFDGLGGTALDTPFAGTYVPLRHHRRDPRVQALMIEIRRDVYMAEPGGDPTAGLDAVAAALAGLVAAQTP
ncbi:N-formylglutamate amidohydrolase [Streptomyces sp. NPDC060194]|uniref:N-formylglutamate amidohydrolase n=1 Tax=Streptomyces sp. NPDC060194 TaxID=3347069 RepID=UPI00365A27C3